MKLTKNQLRVLIKEEISDILSEEEDESSERMFVETPQILKTAVANSRRLGSGFDDFEEFRRFVDNEELISRLISATKDLKSTSRLDLWLAGCIFELKQGNSEEIEDFISRQEREIEIGYRDW